MSEVLSATRRAALLPLEATAAAAGVASGLGYMGACAAARAAGSVAYGWMGRDPMRSVRGTWNSLKLLLR